jgi:DNA-binding NarL/FixJ family response regulator
MIVADHQMIREGLVAMLNPCEDIRVVGAFEGDETINQVIRANDPDVVILENRMRVINSVTVAEEIIAQRPQKKVIVVNVFEDSNYMCQALQAGVDGYIPKYVSSEKLIDSIVRVYQGEKIICAALINDVVNEYVKLSQLKPIGGSSEKTIQFTSREKEILYYLAKGMTNKELSAVTHSSVDTVKTHLRNIFRKLDVKNRCQAVTQCSKYISHINPPN